MDTRVDPDGVAAAGAAVTETGARRWLVSARVDLWTVFGIGAAWSALAAISLWAGGGFLFVAAMFALLADFPHVLQTSLRVWFDPVERHLHGRHYLVSLAAIGTVVGVLASTGRFVVVAAIFLAWQIFHVIKQHIGMVAIYAAKAGYRGTRTLAKWALVLGCLAPVLYRVGDGVQFGSYVINGYALPFSQLDLPLPHIPFPIVVVGYVAAVAAVGAFAVEQLRRRRTGQGVLPGVALLTIVVAIAFYNASYLLVSDPYALTLIATTFHSVQYHLISWARNRGRFRQPEPKPLLLARLSAPRSLALLAIALIIPGALLSAGEFVLAGAIPFTIVLHHFYLDGVLWKPRRNPGLAADLSLRASR